MPITTDSALLKTLLHEGIFLMRDFHLPGRSTVLASNGMCATSHPLATTAAIDVLKKGGNAVDAAITGALLLGLCEPHMTGLGGDMFALIQKNPSSDILALNGSGRAPKNLSATNLRKQGFSTVPLNSVASITIPGAVDGFCQIMKDFGKLGLEEVLAPAIHYAREGIPVAPRVAFDWDEGATRLQGTAVDKFLLNGAAPKMGQIFCSPTQAQALELIASKGRDGFYDGPVAADMVESLQKLGGSHTLEDFLATKATYSTPLQSNYRGVEMLEHPANGQGATALLMLNVMKHFQFSKLDPFGAKRAHIETEISKFAYAARDKFIADLDYTNRISHMLASETALNIADKINSKKAIKSLSTISEAIHKDTVYITVVDKDRMAVSLIYSIFHSFGSGIASNKYGILFQNRGAGFTLEQDHPNELAGGKRPMHTIIPGMLAERGRVTMPFGVMGGGYQPKGHARLLSNMLDFDLNIQEAIDGPRSFYENGVLKLERGYVSNVRQQLVEMGHKVQIPHGPIGGAQAIMIGENGVLTGASDPRKDGCALGY